MRQLGPLLCRPGAAELSAAVSVVFLGIAGGIMLALVAGCGSAIVEPASQPADLAAVQSAAGSSVVGTGPEAVQEFFAFTDWPANPVSLELGDRRIELLPIPGHHNDDLAFYDSASKLMVTGDTLYPGRLYITDWSAYRSSISRLMRWAGTRDISYVMGTHIEMSSTPDVDYPIGTTYQPDELALPLSVSDIARLEAATKRMDTPVRTYLGNFILWPKN